MVEFVDILDIPAGRLGLSVCQNTSAGMRAEVKNQVKSSTRIQNLLLKQPNPVHSGIRQIQQLSSDMLTVILVILEILELRQLRRNMNDTQAVKKKRAQTSHVTTSVRVFQHGAERGGLYNQQEVWFQLSAH